MEGQRTEGWRTGSLLLLLVCVCTADGQPLDVCASCHANATCEDKADGSGKVCHCKYGFVGNGRTFCQDKDECQIGASRICGLHTSCYNTYGSFYCTCLHGYRPSNHMTDGYRPPNTMTDGYRPSNHMTDGYRPPNTMTDGYRPPNTMTDGYRPPNHMTDGYRPRNTMTDGYRPSNHMTDGYRPPNHMTDGYRPPNTTVDGYRLPNHMTDGYRPPNHMTDGYRPSNTMMEGPPPSNNRSIFIPNDGTQCQDVDECQWPGVCGEGGQCRNLEGGFDCSCQSGYKVQDGEEPFQPWRGGASCTVVDCGPPVPPVHSVLLSLSGTSYGAVASFSCRDGFIWTRGHNQSECGEDGAWRGDAMVCQEVSCGDPPVLPHAVHQWDGVSSPGSSLTYSCETGYRYLEGSNLSVCSVSGSWSLPDLTCSETVCGEPVSPPHASLRWNGSWSVGSLVYLVCEEGFWASGRRHYSVCREDGLWDHSDLLCHAGCGPPPSLPDSEVVWTNGTLAVHRCRDGYHSWRGHNLSTCGDSGLWRDATLRCREVKPPINQLKVFNGNCLYWEAHKYQEDTELYQVTVLGSRAFQWSFRDRRRTTLSSREDNLTLCLRLLPVTNYSVSVTAATARFTSTITINTSLQVPAAPDVDYREEENPRPTLRLRRTPDTLDPISVFQVVVVPVDGVVTFDCSAPLSSGSEYIAAQFEVGLVGAELVFPVGNGGFYGGFYNAPLRTDREYYVLLRRSAHWRTVTKSSCVLWAKVSGTSSMLKVWSVSAVLVLLVLVLVLLGGLSLLRCVRKNMKTSNRL